MENAKVEEVEEGREEEDEDEGETNETELSPSGEASKAEVARPSYFGRLRSKSHRIRLKAQRQGGKGDEPKERQVVLVGRRRR